MLYTEKCVSRSSHVWLFATPWTVAHQAFRQLKIHPRLYNIRKEEKRQKITTVSWRCQLSQGWRRESICSQAYSRQLRKHSLGIGLWRALLDGSSSQQQRDGGGSARCTYKEWGQMALPWTWAMQEEPELHILAVSLPCVSDALCCLFGWHITAICG